MFSSHRLLNYYPKAQGLLGSKTQVFCFDGLAQQAHLLDGQLTAAHREQIILKRTAIKYLRVILKYLEIYFQILATKFQLTRTNKINYFICEQRVSKVNSIFIIEFMHV